MVDLTFHKVYWCAHHGHPALALQVTGSDQCLVLALGAEDAMALAAAQMPGPAGTSRMHDLFQAAVQELGGRLAALQLCLGPDAVVRAIVHLDGPRGALILPAHIADGIALALRTGIPLWMADDELASFAATTTAPRPAAWSAPEPFRSLVESLDLEGFGEPGIA